jgi:hypothetical protein
LPLRGSHAGFPSGWSFRRVRRRIVVTVGRLWRKPGRLKGRSFVQRTPQCRAGLRHTRPTSLRRYTLRFYSFVIPPSPPRHLRPVFVTARFTSQTETPASPTRSVSSAPRRLASRHRWHCQRGRFADNLNSAGFPERWAGGSGSADRPG